MNNSGLGIKELLWMNQMEAIDIVTVHEVVKEKVNLLNRNMK